jgi:hypothetical protein
MTPILAFTVLELVLALVIIVAVGLAVLRQLSGSGGSSRPSHSLTFPPAYGDWGNVPAQIGAKHEFVEYYVREGGIDVPDIEVEFTIEKKQNVLHINSNNFTAVRDDYSLYVGTIKTDSKGLAFLRLRSNVEKPDKVTIKVRVKGIRGWREDDAPKTIPVVP